MPGFSVQALSIAYGEHLFENKKHDEAGLGILLLTSSLKRFEVL